MSLPGTSTHISVRPWSQIHRFILCVIYCIWTHMDYKSLSQAQFHTSFSLLFFTHHFVVRFCHNLFIGTAKPFSAFIIYETCTVTDIDCGALHCSQLVQNAIQLLLFHATSRSVSCEQVKPPDRGTEAVQRSLGEQSIVAGTCHDTHTCCHWTPF